MNVPLESYTTKEIDFFIKNPALVKVLREADRVFYSNKVEIDIKQKLSALTDFTQEEYDKMLDKEFKTINLKTKEEIVGDTIQ
jgi:hypothetical protein